MGSKKKRDVYVSDIMKTSLTSKQDGRRKLTDEDIEQIKYLSDRGWNNTDLAQKFNVSPTTIRSKLKAGKTPEAIRAYQRARYQLLKDDPEEMEKRRASCRRCYHKKLKLYDDGELKV